MTTIPTKFTSLPAVISVYFDRETSEDAAAAIDVLHFHREEIDLRETLLAAW